MTEKGLSVGDRKVTSLGGLCKTEQNVGCVQGKERQEGQEIGE